MGKINRLTYERTTKIPPLLSNSRNESRLYIIHTKEPAFIAKIFYPESEAEERSIKSKLNYWVELEAPKTIIAVIELWQPVSSEDKFKAILKRLRHWYCSILNETI